MGVINKWGYRVEKVHNIILQRSIWTSSREFS
jgi:hypothetical protein